VFSDEKFVFQFILGRLETFKNLKYISRQNQNLDFEVYQIQVILLLKLDTDKNLTISLYLIINLILKS
jgi:hypothetical protein